MITQAAAIIDAISIMYKSITQSIFIILLQLFFWKQRKATNRY
jgi:hypothetical protein